MACFLVNVRIFGRNEPRNNCFIIFKVNDNECFWKQWNGIAIIIISSSSIVAVADPGEGAQQAPPPP